MVNEIIYKNLQMQLNSKVPIWLEMIEKEYGQYMNEEQKALLESLKSSENIIVEKNADKWLENQIQDIKNNPNLSEEQKQKEIEETKNYKVTAHGGKVFGDQKIHFYPFNIKSRENETLESVCEGMLVHELFHYFVKPEYMNIANVENSDKINSYITEGMVDMCAIDLMVKNNVLNTYTSNYATNVIFVRENLEKVESEKEKMNLIFHGDMKQITGMMFKSQEELVQKYDDSKNKKTPTDNMIKEVAFNCDTKNSEGVERAIYNIAANAKTKQETVNNIKNIGSKIYPEKHEKINQVVDNYSKNEEQRKLNEKQQSRDEERQNLLQQKRDVERKQLMEQINQIESIKNNEVYNTHQNNMDKPIARKLVPTNPNQNNDNKNGFTNILLLSLITSGFVVLVALLTMLFIK